MTDNAVVPSSTMDMIVEYPASERDPDQTPKIGKFIDIYHEYYKPGHWFSVIMNNFLPALVKHVASERKVSNSEAMKQILKDLSEVNPDAAEDLVEWMDGMNETSDLFRSMAEEMLPKLDKGAEQIGD